MSDKIPDGFELERLVWAYAHSVVDFETRVRRDEFDSDEERGYAKGMWQQSLDILEMFLAEGVDVVDVAESYAEESEDNISIYPAWVEDSDIEVDFRKQGWSFTAVPEHLEDDPYAE